MAKICLNDRTLSLGDTRCINGILYEATAGPFQSEEACEGEINPPPSVTFSDDDICQDATTGTIAGTNFNTALPGYNLVTLNRGASATCTEVNGAGTLLTYAFTVLPTSLGALTAVVVTPAGSSAPAVQIGTVIDCNVLIWFDSFTGPDGTSLTAHTPDVSPGGVGYTDPQLDLQIQSNKVISSGSFGEVYFDPGVTSATATVTIAATVTSPTSPAGVRLSPRKTAGSPFGISVNVGLSSSGYVSLDISDGVTSVNGFASGTSGEMEVIVTPTRITLTYNGSSVLLDTTVDATNTVWNLFVENPTAGTVTVDDLTVTA